MNQTDIDWFRDALSTICDELADITESKEAKELIADPDGRGGLDFSWAGFFFDRAYDEMRKSLKEARRMKPIKEDLGK
jgi:hypothetical protein